jgi:nicotinic acid mononucleotide adenylyltransferase
MPTNEQIEKTYKQFFENSFESCSPQTIMHRVKSQVNFEECRIASRLWLDPYYKILFEKTNSYQACLDAGYFDDRSWDSVFLHIDQEVSRMLTPFQNVIDGLKIVPKDNQKPFAVLLTTGCFAPVHNGHFDMMEQAKITVEKAGYHVLGGYMSPSHDSYVNTKENGNLRMNIMKRIQLLELAAQDHPWINIDPWEGVYNSISLNFTDVIAYLHNYLNYHINSDFYIDIFYVFGADNAHFANAFIGKGHGVIVNRYGYDIDITDNPRILISKIPNNREISSTIIRRGYHEQLPSTVLEIYRNSLALDKPRTNINIAIRKDSSYALSKWITPENCDLMKAQYNDLFASELKKLLLWAFESHDTKIFEVDITKQRQYIKTLRKKGVGIVVSLDPICPMVSNIRVSRVFPMSGNQLKRLRTDISGVKLHLNNTSSKCYLVDDDIVSGKTMEIVADEFIPKHLDIIQVSLLPYGLDKQDSKIVFDEILDERDFLLGSKDGGLVCELPNGKLARVPYILPFVNPIWRASMDAEMVIIFSREVWLRNIDFFSTNTDILVKHADPKAQTLFNYLGYGPATTLLEIATHYWSIMNRYA